MLITLLVVGGATALGARFALRRRGASTEAPERAARPFPASGGEGEPRQSVEPEPDGDAEALIDRRLATAGGVGRSETLSRGLGLVTLAGIFTVHIGVGHAVALYQAGIAGAVGNALVSPIDGIAAGGNDGASTSDSASGRIDFVALPPAERPAIPEVRRYVG